jgi:hypothetical protein
MNTLSIEQDGSLPCPELTQEGVASASSRRFVCSQPGGWSKLVVFFQEVLAVSGETTRASGPDPQPVTSGQLHVEMSGPHQQVEGCWRVGLGL